MLILTFFTAFLPLVTLFVGAVNPDALEGLPGQIIQKFRDNRDQETIDLLNELQGTFEWANSQPEWAEFAFPIDQIIPVPMIGNVNLHIESLSFTQFDATKDNGAPIVERTAYGFRLGNFNIGVELAGIEITTSGFFASTHTGKLSIELQDCYLEIEMIEGQSVPRVTGTIGFSQYTFKSPSIMTELLLTPVLLLSESIMNETIEDAFAYYMTQFWLPVDMEFYIAVAADAFMESERSTEGLILLDEGEEQEGEEVELSAIDEDSYVELEEPIIAKAAVSHRANGMRFRYLRD